MDKDTKIYIAGHTGLVGSAVVTAFKKERYRNIVTKTHQELDLLQQSDVENFFKAERPECVILAAAKVGGIKANIDYPAQFIYDNLTIQTNVIHLSYKYGVKKLLFFGSACAYPRECSQPMKEEYLLSGYLEPTNEPYAVAKIAGIKLCEAYNKQYSTNFICGIPATIYGPNDNFDPDNSHVIPALIAKFHEAKVKNLPSVTIWGSGKPRREFVYVEEVAEACLFLMHNCDEDVINVGCGEDISVKDLTLLIKDIVRFEGEITFDRSKPDGMLKKLLDNSKIKSLGWKANVNLEEGLKRTYEWYKKGIK
ncbi:GDP-L-fucose synthase [bacterium]|nr:GDP-L-fucose synthase [bacterium]